MRFSEAGLASADLLRRLTSVPRLRIRQVLPVDGDEPAAVVLDGAAAEEVDGELPAEFSLDNFVEIAEGIADEAVDL